MGNGFKVLIVDNDPLMKSYLKSFLTSFGYKIFSTRNGPDTLSEVISIDPNLILFNLPFGSSSLETVKQLSNHGKKIPIILLGNLQQIPPINKHFYDRNGIEVVKKPLDYQELFLKISKICNPHPQEEVLKGKSEKRVKRKNEHPHLLFGSSKKMEEVRTVIDQVAKTDITVLIDGESGTGKELVARTLYTCSTRVDRPFVKVLCAAIPDGLLESELFGHEKGSFTGAHRSNPGKFEFANHGTIFLDEIGDIPFSLQAKLLQVLQDGEFSRLGGNEIKVDVRVIAATNKQLEVAVRQGTFREDLFYRLNVVSIHLPSLRDRKEDIPTLTDLFVRKYGQQFNRDMKSISDHNMKRFLDYEWPGNVRELENMVKRIVILGDEEAAVRNYFQEKEESFDLYSYSQVKKPVSEPVSPARVSADSSSFSLKKAGRAAARKAESDIIKRVLQDTHWNRKETAKFLRISYKALLYKIKECNWDQETQEQR